MALTTNQLVVGMFNMAAGGYKTLVGDYMTANGATATADTLLAASGLNPQFMGTNLLSNTDFASGLIGRVLSGLSSSIQSSIATIVSNYMTANPTLTRGAVVVAVLEAVLAVPTTDATLGTAVSSFTSKVALADASTSTSTDFTVLSQVVGGTGSTVTPGQSFVLTTGVDTITATSGNDTINGTIDTIANGGTFSAGDNISGGSGTDTLNITLTDNTKTAVVTMAGVETILGTVAGAGAPAGVSAANWTGVTEVGAKGTITSHAANSAFTVSNIQNNVTLSLKNITVGTANDVALTAGFGTSKIGSTTATATVTADAVGAKSLAAGLTIDTNTDVFTKMTIAATNANYVYLNASADADVELTDLTVTGTGSLVLTADGTNVEFTGLKTIDASANTGGVTIDASGNATGTTNLKFTGGSGNDSLTLAAADLGTTMTLAGGTGTDTLAIGAVTNTGTTNTMSAAQGARISGFEIIKVTAAGVLGDANSITTDASLSTGVTEIQLAAATGTAGGGASTNDVTNLVNGGKVTILGNQATDLTNTLTFKAAALSDTTRTMTVELGDSVAKTAATVLSLTVANATDLTFKSEGAANTITAQTTTDVKNILVTGTKQLTLSGAVDGASLRTIDASGMVLTAATSSGLTMVTASTNVDTTAGSPGLTITGSMGVDTLLASAEASSKTSLYGGGGIDSMTGHANSLDTFLYKALSETGTTTATSDTIATFDVTKDVVKFSGVTFAGTFTVAGTTAFTGGGNSSAYVDANNDLAIDSTGDGTIDALIVGTFTGFTAANMIIA